MGVDVLAITFKIERAFGVKLRPEDWRSLTVHQAWREIRASDLLALVRRIATSRPRCSIPAICWSCRYDLSGLELGVPCPECGLAVHWLDGRTEGAWEVVRNILSHELAIPVERIQPQSRLVVDLGME